MKPEELEKMLLEKSYLRGGTIEACVIIRMFLSHVHSEDWKNSEKIATYAHAGVSGQEFIKAVRTLMAFAIEQDDTLPRRWRSECRSSFLDIECKKHRNSLCVGEFNLADNSKEVCPYFEGQF